MQSNYKGSRDPGIQGSRMKRTRCANIKTLHHFILHQDDSNWRLDPPKGSESLFSLESESMHLSSNKHYPGYFTDYLQKTLIKYSKNWQFSSLTPYCIPYHALYFTITFFFMQIWVCMSELSTWRQPLYLPRHLD